MATRPPTSPRIAELSALIALAAPIVASHSGNVIMGVVDTIVAGRIGTTAVGALALAHTAYLLFVVFARGIILGMDPYVSQAVGAGDRERQARGLDAGLTSAWVLSLPVVLATLASPWALRAMGQPPAVVDEVEVYLNIVAWSAPLTLFASVWSTWLAAHGRTGVLVPIAVATNVVNLFLSAGLGLGLMGLPALGVQGIAIATLTCRALELAGLYLWVRGGPNASWLSTPRRRASLDVMRSVWRTGLPVGAQYALEFAGFGMATLLIGLLGEDEVAGHQVAINVASLTFTVALGISAAASVRVGHAVGRRDIEAVRRAGWTAWAVGAVFGTVCAVLLFVTRHEIVGLYVGGGRVSDFAASLLLIAAVFQLADMTQAIGFGVLRGLSDTRLPALFNVLAYWLVGLPVGGWFALKVTERPEPVWWGLTGALAIVALLLIARFRALTRTVLVREPLEPSPRVG